MAPAKRNLIGVVLAAGTRSVGPNYLETGWGQADVVRGAALSEMHRRAKLAVLYDEIYEHYSARDPKLVRRRLMQEALQSRVMLIGQALGRDTQRLSGIPYYSPPAEHPTLSRGGLELDKFLAGFHYTIQLGGAGQYAYHTDLARYFPGRG